MRHVLAHRRERIARICGPCPPNGLTDQLGDWYMTLMVWLAMRKYTECNQWHATRCDNINQYLLNGNCQQANANCSCVFRSDKDCAALVIINIPHSYTHVCVCLMFERYVRWLDTAIPNVSISVYSLGFN